MIQSRSVCQGGRERNIEDVVQPVQLHRAPPKKDKRPMPPSDPARWVGEMVELSWRPRATIFKNFLTPQECDMLIALSRPKMVNSTVVDPKTGERVPSAVRTSTGTFFGLGEHPVLRDIESRISAVTHLPAVNGEGVQVLHYHNGQRYEQHHDFLIDSINPAPENGGQRMMTFLMYLTTVEEGGETLFPLAEGPLPPGPEYDSLRPTKPSECARRGGLAIAPKRGDALMFHSLHPDLSKDVSSLHASCPTLRGEKWSATKWLRLDAYSGNLDAAANAARKARLAAEKHCKDWNANCAMWASSGECQRNAGWMNVQCQRSCHSCKLPAEGEGTEAPRSPAAIRADGGGAALQRPYGIQAVKESDETLR
ncbi:hypothetical protein WJX81_007420 [Elliptochloris bilobata]|uniref:procollagen-proline 4-dioxygenase n=1 Tax=Elliptochloris bilobata TaxID=381761 RepID=A0AAW1RWP0_9CHLO